MTEEVPVAAWLTKPFWPWPLALAYSQAAADREAALVAAVEVLEAYPRLGSMADYTGIGAVHRVYEIVTNEQGVSRLEEETMRRIEAPLIAAIETAKLVAQGRRSPASLFEDIRVADWVGAEIDSEATCDLVKAGWREKSSSFDALFGDEQRVVWFHDVHLPRAGMLAAFGPLTASEAVPVAAPEPWTEERMKAEIAACTISDRDRAWREKFKPIREQHGWDVTAFRGVWSEGRGTKGMTGRPVKSAQQSA